ncbi:hypothetical protein TNCV_4074411 [Trichonephila clavipes]|uniref:Uncharacterized protein n=1 Tax=Trichonephila clavipes TaxID=2585209 RepID=A0A8X6W862_TRICX|nr:hypothetical protein TNCV_4074411 [Trichonephila clavipes]
MHLKSSSDHVQIMMLWVDLGRPSWRLHHLFGNDFLAGRSLSGNLKRSSHLRLRLVSFKPTNGSPSQ